MKEFLVYLKSRVKFPHLLFIGYLLFMAFAYWYVNRVLSEGDLKVTTKESQKTQEVKPVDVILKVKTPYGTKDYKARLQNTDTVRDLLDKIQDEQEFSYERTFYTDKVVIDEINGIKPIKGQIWDVKVGESSITNLLDRTNLVDGTTYIVSLVP